jgi:hypothetical protein
VGGATAKRVIKLYTYNAGKGDCIRLSFGNGHNVFIDSGVTRFATELQRILYSITADGETLDTPYNDHQTLK